MNNIKFEIIEIQKPESINFILGQSHFIKTVEDIHEVLVTTVPKIKFGLAFCEASGPRLIRVTGTDKDMKVLASKNAQRIGAGHSFILFLGEGFFPVNVLKSVQSVNEVVNIFCATANPTQVVIAKSDKGRGIVGVIDGGSPKGVESEQDVKERVKFLKDIGYKQ